MDKYLIDLSNFVEEESIGNGNYGTVYLAHLKDKKDKKCALKKIPCDKNDTNLYKKITREVQIMANLNHPNLIRLIGFSFPSEKDKSFTIISNYLPNDTLHVVLEKDHVLPVKEKVLNPTRLSIIIYGIASAMLYIHRKNIIHRDLKPENIFLDEEYRPVLSDFGFSSMDDHCTFEAQFGTPYFMAPELFYDDENIPSSKIDVYAYGIILLSVFSMDYTFEGIQPRTIYQLINKIVDGKRFIIPKKVPEFYVRMITKCWADDPNQRPSFEEIVKEFNNNDDFILPNADIEQVHDYMNYLMRIEYEKK